jgi:hypothetical protein
MRETEREPERATSREFIRVPDLRHIGDEHLWILHNFIATIMSLHPDRPQQDNGRLYFICDTSCDAG